MNTTRIMIAEDNSFYRKGLESLLQEVDGVLVTGSAPNGADLLKMLAANPPELVFTDIQMPVMGGIELTRIVKQGHPDIKILALTQFVEEDLITDMIEAGAKGYLEKSSTLEEITHAVNYVSRGYHYYCPRTTEQMISLLTRRTLKAEQKAAVRQLFSAQEHQIIRLICSGYSTKQIAPEVHLSEAAVEKHRSRIMQKARARSMVGLIVYATRHGLYDGHTNEA